MPCRSFVYVWGLPQKEGSGFLPTGTKPPRFFGAFCGSVATLPMLARTFSLPLIQTKTENCQTSAQKNKAAQPLWVVPLSWVFWFAKKAS